MCLYKLVTSMCYRPPSVLDPQEIYVCYSHSYRGLVCFLKLQQLMLLALEVPGVIYSELSKMVSVTEMHRSPHEHVHCTFLLHSSAAQTEYYSKLWVEKQFWMKQEKLLYLLLSQVEWFCRCHSLLTLILEYLCFLTICLTMMTDKKQFDIPIFFSNELCRQFTIKRRLCCKAGSSAGNYAVSRAKRAAAQMAFLAAKCLQFATRGSLVCQTQTVSCVGKHFSQESEDVTERVQTLLRSMMG